MRLRIYERDFEGHTLFNQYEDFEGPSASSIIQAMWDKDIFAETESLSEYVNLLSERVCQEYRIQFMPEGETDDERALSLLQFMDREGIADLADGRDRTT
ncbi:MAG: hypothetical protein OXQ90_09855 [Gammaproteobacteria bacterium]|nr:hypothetical protein [Gammaproteobacteria bacterium]